MEIYIYLIYAAGLLFNGYIFWVLLQLALASRGSRKASEKWVALVNSPIMQLLGIKWSSLLLSIAMAVQVISLTLLACVSIYTGEPINLN